MTQNSDKHKICRSKTDVLKQEDIYGSLLRDLAYARVAQENNGISIPFLLGAYIGALEERIVALDRQVRDLSSGYEALINHLTSDVNSATPSKDRS